MTQTMLLIVLALPALAAAQTTQPSYEMTPQMRERMEALSQPTTQAASRPADDSPEVKAARRAAYIGRQQDRAELVRQMTEHKRAVAEIVAELDRQIADVRQQGQAAAVQLNQLVAAHDGAEAAANDAGRFSLFGWVEDDHGRQSQITGTLDSPAMRLAALQQVDEHYGPAIAEAKRQVLTLYQEYQRLAQNRAALVKR